MSSKFSRRPRVQQPPPACKSKRPGRIPHVLRIQLYATLNHAPGYWYYENQLPLTVDQADPTHWTYLPPAQPAPYTSEIDLTYNETTGQYEGNAIILDPDYKPFTVWFLATSPNPPPAYPLDLNPTTDYPYSIDLAADLPS